MGRETRVQRDVLFSSLVEHGDGVALPKSGIGGATQFAHVGDIAFVPYVVPVDVTAHAFYQAVVADGDILERGVPDARGKAEALLQFHALLVDSQLDFPVEVGVRDCVGEEVLGHVDGGPVFSGAALPLQGGYLIQR